MSIKGKGRTKPRPTARAPRREPVPVKPPFFVRRWVQVVGAFVLGISAMMFLVWVTNGLREQSRAERARRKEAAELVSTRRVVEAWSGLVGTEVGKLGGQVTDPTVPPTLLTAASAAIDGVAAGDEVHGAAGAFAEAEAELQKAIATLDGYALVDQIRDKGFDVTQTNYLLNSKTKFVEALRIYRHAVGVAASAPGAQVGKIAAGLRDRAVSLFAGGWGDLQQVKQSAGIGNVPAAAGS
jgi:hypothetical protein